MKIVIDADIPFIKGVFEPYCSVVYLKGAEFRRELLEDADALIIRTRTKCNYDLLHGTSVKFIATATIGTDHIDLDYCREAGIEVSNAAGCNSGGVMQYVFTALYGLADKKGFELPPTGVHGVAAQTESQADEPGAHAQEESPADEPGAHAQAESQADVESADGLSGRKDTGSKRGLKRVMGVIGVGNVGSKVANLAEYLGFEVLRCDPLKERAQTIAFNVGELRIEDFKDYYSLEYLLEHSDIVTMHTWLDAATCGMASAKFFDTMKAGAVFINASRGEVVDEKALLVAVDKFSAVVLDVWNHEPEIDRNLIQKVDIATPHIAGYSYEGKVNGTEMSVRAVAEYFGITPLKAFETFKNDYKRIYLDFRGVNNLQISKKLTEIFPIFEDDFNLRNNPESFEKLRNNYNYRREFYVNPTTKTTDCREGNCPGKI